MVFSTYVDMEYGNPVSGNWIQYTDALHSAEQDYCILLFFFESHDHKDLDIRSTVTTGTSLHSLCKMIKAINLLQKYKDLFRQ